MRQRMHQQPSLPPRSPNTLTKSDQFSDVAGSHEKVIELLIGYYYPGDNIYRIQPSPKAPTVGDLALS
jgi:hypothetical protein